uniref:Uncharacterized protein n=1 Tax=Rhipicephalus zambeziensis TaxID=60191 RepID=A0A224YBT9_9ACAR
MKCPGCLGQGGPSSLSDPGGNGACPAGLAPLCAFLYVPFFPSPFSLPSFSMNASVLYGSPRGPVSRKPSVDNDMCGGQAKSKDTAHPRRLLGAAQDSRRSAAAPSLWGWRAWVLGDWTSYSCALGWVCV